ncbi:tripartite tricarboxylate transporter TctB family protein [Agrobacterium sp. ES01]|uniref:tripartite tricarboxylate transporter TctB family protein n=1 Tax=Agrobacterium sp. ES01 TaxID=3420714 RepID=UPI003D0B0A3A
MSDRVFGTIGILLAAFYIWQATLIEESFISDPVGPKTFPIVIATLLGVASLFILLMPDEEPKWPALSRLIEIFISVAVLVAYTYLLPAIGFVFSTVLASSFLAWRLGAKPVHSVIAGVLISVGIYAIFHLALGLTLAKGPFGF